MSGITRSSVLRLITIASLLILAFTFTKPVFADSATPTPQPATATDPASPTPVVDAPTPVASETPVAPNPTETLPVATETPTEVTPAPTDTPTAVTDTLTAVPTILETTAVPTKTPTPTLQGSVLDPWFVTGTIKHIYLSGAGACVGITPVAPITAIDCHDGLSNPIQFAVDAIDTAGLPTDKTVHIDAGNFTGNVTVNGLAHPLLVGLTALVGAGSDTTLPYTQIDGTIDISNMTNGFTLSGLIVNTAVAVIAPVQIHDNGGTITLNNFSVRNTSTGGGINLYNHKGAVIFTNVNASNNGNYGAYVDTTQGTGNVTINSSNFASNGSYGLNVISNGLVTLNGAMFYSNTGNGVTVKAGKGLTVKNSAFYYNSGSFSGYGLATTTDTLGNILVDSSYAYANNMDGLLLISRSGSITVTNSASSSNSRYGLNLDNCLVSGSVCTASSQPITIKNVVAKSNSQSNIYIISNGNISLDQVTATSNGVGDGTYLDASRAVGNTTVIVTRSDFSNGNQSGLHVTAKGSITLNNVTVESANSFGAFLDNTAGTGGVSVLATLGTNYFSDNHDSGLYIRSKGPVVVTSTTADNNSVNPSASGINISTTSSVTLNGNSANENDVSSNSAYGLVVTAGTTTSINYLTASGNGYDNIYIVNNGNGSNSLSNVDTSNSKGAGAILQGKGPVNINTLDASYNAAWGLWVDNRSTLKQGVTLTFVRTDYNQGNGLTIQSSGPVSLVKIDSTGNSINNGTITWGDKIQDMLYYGNDNWSFAATAGDSLQVSVHAQYNINLYIFKPSLVSAWQTITGSNHPTFATGSLPDTGTYVIRLGGYGGVYTVWMNHSGPVEPVSPTRYSQASGVVVDNTFSSSTSGVSLINDLLPSTSVSYNGINGVSITSNGAVTVKNVSAQTNGNYGIVVNSTGAGSYTFSGDDIEYNNNIGLSINGSGSVLLVGLYASQNKGDGIDVSTTGVVTSTPLANTISTSGSNQGNGLSINTLGTVNLKGFTTTYNTGTGILIVNNTGTGGVTLQNVISSNNTLKGIDVTTRGPISITTATAESNTGQNASLANNTAASPQPVSITNGQFNSSTVEGLVVTSKGTITLANVNAFYNNTTSGTAAVSLTNTPGTGGVSIQNSKFDYNYATVAALNVLTDGSITLSGDEIYDNYNGKGAYLQSNTAKVNNASISNSNFSSNHLTGLDLTTNGAITLTNINSQYNLGYGVLLENDFGAKGSVTILTSGTGTNWIQSSPNDGLKIISNGSVTVKNLTSTGNTGNGISITTGNGFPVTLINITTSYNSLDGINVTDNGGVVMDQVNAIQNTGNGVILDVNPGLSKPVTVTRSSFSYNNLLGLQVVTDGLITVNNITATSNYGIASVDLENQGATALVGVNILNTYGGNTFTNNSGEGLVVKTKGNIVANGLNATGNGGAGVGLNNSYGSGTVSVNGGFFKDNAGQDTSTFIYGGLVINSNNNVTATNIQSFFNGNSGNGYGLYVNSNGHNFALSNSAILGNENSGIYAHVLPGVVTILNTTYFGNMLNGGTSNLVIN